jgi:hypothetical protein
MEPGIELALLVTVIAGLVAVIRILMPEPGPRRRTAATVSRPTAPR